MVGWHFALYAFFWKTAFLWITRGSKLALHIFAYAICIYKYIYIYTCALVCIYIYEHAHSYIHIGLRAHIYIYVCRERYICMNHIPGFPPSSYSHRAGKWSRPLVSPYGISGILAVFRSE